jgi:phage-related tail fiber protein
LSWSDIIVTFDSNAASGTATLWNDTNYPCVRTVNGYSCGGGSPSFTKIGTVPYETRSVAGTSILVIFAQSSVDEAGYPIYSARSGSVYRGIFTPKGHAYNSSLYFNRTAFDAILNSWSKPAVLN